MHKVERNMSFSMTWDHTADTFDYRANVFLLLVTGLLRDDRRSDADDAISGSEKSATCGRHIRAQLPIDKSNSRFLRQTVQSFLHQVSRYGDSERSIIVGSSNQIPTVN